VKVITGLHEVVTYDHAKDEASVTIADKKTGKFGEPKKYTTPARFAIL